MMIYVYSAACVYLPSNQFIIQETLTYSIVVECDV